MIRKVRRNAGQYAWPPGCAAAGALFESRAKYSRLRIAVNKYGNAAVDAGLRFATER
jgi:hypothetical protein